MKYCKKCCVVVSFYEHYTCNTTFCIHCSLQHNYNSQKMSYKYSMKDLFYKKNCPIELRLHIFLDKVSGKNM